MTCVCYVEMVFLTLSKKKKVVFHVLVCRHGTFIYVRLWSVGVRARGSASSKQYYFCSREKKSVFTKRQWLMLLSVRGK